MTHVVQRCPSCGVEHDASDAGACEACGTALRAWCRLHGRETGWLATSTCARCDDEAARPRPAPPPRVASPPAARPTRPAAAPATGGWPGRSPREILRGPPPPHAPEAAVEETQGGWGRAVGVTVGYTAVSAFSGAFVAGALGAQEGYGEKAALIGAIILGLAGLMVGALRALALLRDAPSREE
jgi:hypothetical protein